MGVGMLICFLTSIYLEPALVNSRRLVSRWLSDTFYMSPVQSELAIGGHCDLSLCSATATFPFLLFIF